MERAIADFTRPGGIPRAFGVPVDGDRWHLGAYYLVDAILRTGGGPFTTANLVEQDDGLGAGDVSVDSRRKVEALCEHFVTHGVLEISSGRNATSTYYEDSPETQTVTYRLTGEIVAKLAAFARVDERERAELRPKDVGGQPWAETGAPPQFVGMHYELLAELDRTGMGSVYRARDRRSGQLVALKMLSASQVAGSPEMEQRFRRNAGIAAELVHPNVVRTLDVFLHENAPTLVMELVEGTPLRNLIDQVPIPPPDAVNITLGLLDALAYLHASGIVRCDLKPSGIMVDRSLKPVILDLGIAKRAAQDSAPASDLTRTGIVIGTPAYLAPEQVTGGVVDQRSDLFTVAALTVEMLTGRPPRGEGDLFEVLNRAVQEDIDVDQLRVSLELRGALRTALARDPDQRYTTAADMRAALLATPEASAVDGSAVSRSDRTVIRDGPSTPE
jgi:serine/threonine-protein kinase